MRSQIQSLQDKLVSSRAVGQSGYISSDIVTQQLAAKLQRAEQVVAQLRQQNERLNQTKRLALQGI